MSAVNNTMSTSSSSANTNTEQWQCADRACTTGQTLLDRNEFGRKVVSDFFGRNKRETKEIHPDVWHMMCRMSYQRNKYNADKGGPKALCDFYLTHIKAQLRRIQLWRPDSTFTVQLERPAKQRLVTYHERLRRNGGDTQEAEQHIAPAARVGKKGKPLPLSLVAAVKVAHAEHIDASLSGPGKTLDFMTGTVVPWIEAEVASGRMVSMPPIEFLLAAPTPCEWVVDPTTNHARWVALVDGVAYKAPSPPKKVPKLILKVTPRKPIILSLKKKKRADSSSAAAPPASSTSPADSQRPGAASDLPLYRPPPPVRDSSKKRKRPAPLDLAASTLPPPTASATPGSEFTLVDVPPIMRRGMVFGGGTKMYVRRSELDGDDQGEESELDCESPLAKKGRHS